MGILKGVYPPAITIFDLNDQINYSDMERHTDYLIKNGVSGIAYLGTSGEFSVMTLEQKITLIKRMTAYVNHRVKVLIGIGDTCLENTKTMLSVAQDAGADAVLAIAPYFSIYAEENIKAYYREIDECAKIPVLIYNFPTLTGFDMSPALVKDLVITGKHILGIKDTVPEIEHLRLMLEIKKEKPEFSVFCAYESQAFEIIKEGADGLINATSNFAPQYSVKLINSSLKGNEKEMKLCYEKMCTAAQVYQYSTPLLLAVKEAVYQQVLGHEGKEILPGLSLDDAKKNKIHEILNKLTI